MAASDDHAATAREMGDGLAVRAKQLAGEFAREHGVPEPLVTQLLMKFGSEAVTAAGQAQATILKRVLERGGG